jgi:hypothetical protein
MKDDSDEFIPFWPQTAMSSAPYGGILGQLAEPVVEPWSDPRLATYPETPWHPTRPLYPFLQPPGSWDSSSPASRHVPPGADTGFPAQPAEPVVAPWDDPRPATYAQMPSEPMAPPRLFTLSPTFSPAPPLEHLYSGKYWPVAPAPAATQPPAQGSYFSPMPQAPSWDQVPAHPADRAPPIFPEPVVRSSAGTSAGIADDRQRTNSVRTQDDPQVLSDATPDNDWVPGAQYVGVGHHHNPRAVFRKFALPPETRQVFEKATTGPLPFHRWHEYDDLHRLYNNAVEELMNRFMQEHNVKAEQMTPDHARAVLKAIAESENPVIRAYRAMLQHMGRLYRLRSGGRGSE